MIITQLWKSTHYANKFQNYFAVGDRWIPVSATGIGKLKNVSKFWFYDHSPNCVSKNTAENVDQIFLKMADQTNLGKIAIIMYNKCWHADSYCTALLIDPIPSNIQHTPMMSKQTDADPQAVYRFYYQIPSDNPLWLWTWEHSSHICFYL